MIEYSERCNALNAEASETSLPVLLSVDGGITTLLKRHLQSWNASAILLGGLIIFSPLIDGGTTHLPFMIIRLSLLGTALFWMVHQIKGGSIGLPRNRLSPLLVVFLAWSGLTVLLAAPYKNASMQWFISLLCYVILFGLVVQGVRTCRVAEQVLAVVMTMGALEGAFGIVQYLWLGEPRAKGTFFNPNFFATYQVVVLSLVCARLLLVRENEIERWQRGVLWGIGAVAFAAFLLAQSRGALLALVAVVAFVCWCRFGKAALLILILCLTAGAVIPNPLTERMSLISKQDPYAFSRIQIWENSAERIANKPSGYGLGMYKYVSFQYRFPVESNIVRYGKRPESAHNEYLQIAVELGVLGIGLFLMGVVVWMGEARAVLRGPMKPRERGLVVGAAGGVLAILSHGAVDSVFHEPALVILLVVCGGLVLPSRLLRDSNMTEWRVPFSYHPMRLALLLLSGGLLAVLVIQPAAGWYASQRGEVEAHAGKHKLALQWYETASLIDPATPGYHDAAARTSVQLFYQSGNPQLLVNAVVEEKLAMRLNPLDGRFPYRLGTIYSVLAKQNVSEEERVLLLNEAVQAYEQAVQADPYTPLSYFELASIRVPQGREEEARSWLRQAVAYEPDFLPARLRLAELSIRNGNIEDARSQFDAILAAKKKHAGKVLSDLERQFLDVDTFPLGTALARWTER